MNRRRLQTGILLAAIGMVFISVPCQKLDAWQDWNQWLGAERDSVWREDGILTRIPEEGLNVLWRTPVAGGFSGPAVADGHVFVTDYKLHDGDQRFDPSKRSQLKGTERVHCLDATDGSVVWTHETDCDYNISYALGPRATPAVDGDRVYTVGAEGNMFCLNVKDGSEVWKKDIKAEYGLKEAPLWGFSNHPLVVGERIYIVAGGEGSVAVALDKMTGEEVWRSLSAKEQGYCPPTMIEAGGVQQLLIWHAEGINSLNPETGELYWSIPTKVAYNMSIIAPIKHGDYLLLTALQGGSMLLKLDPEKPAATKVWRGKGLNPDHNPPVVFEDHIYGVDVNGRLRCLELVSGERIWESLATCSNGRPEKSTTGFLVRNNDHWYITTEQGELIIAKLSPEGFEEVGRSKMLEPTAENWGRKIVWSHPAFSNKCVFARNDKEIVCISLAE